MYLFKIILAVFLCVASTGFSMQKKVISNPFEIQVIMNNILEKLSDNKKEIEQSIVNKFEKDLISGYESIKSSLKNLQRSENENNIKESTQDGCLLSLAWFSQTLSALYNPYSKFLKHLNTEKNMEKTLNYQSDTFNYFSFYIEKYHNNLDHDEKTKNLLSLSSDLFEAYRNYLSNIFSEEQKKITIRKAIKHCKRITDKDKFRFLTDFDIYLMQWELYKILFLYSNSDESGKFFEELNQKISKSYNLNEIISNIDPNKTFEQLDTIENLTLEIKIFELQKKAHDILNEGNYYNIKNLYEEICEFSIQHKNYINYHEWIIANQVLKLVSLNFLIKNDKINEKDRSNFIEEILNILENLKIESLKNNFHGELAINFINVACDPMISKEVDAKIIEIFNQIDRSKLTKEMSSFVEGYLIAMGLTGRYEFDSFQLNKKNQATLENCLSHSNDAKFFKNKFLLFFIDAVMSMDIDERSLIQKKQVFYKIIRYINEYFDEYNKNESQKNNNNPILKLPIFELLTQALKYRDEYKEQKWSKSILSLKDARIYVDILKSSEIPKFLEIAKLHKLILDMEEFPNKLSKCIEIEEGIEQLQALDEKIIPTCDSHDKNIYIKDDQDLYLENIIVKKYSEHERLIGEIKGLIKKLKLGKGKFKFKEIEKKLDTLNNIMGTSFKIYGHLEHNRRNIIKGKPKKLSAYSKKLQEALDAFLELKSKL